jgi:hypothetical protein
MGMTRKELLMGHTSWIDYCCHVLDTKQDSPTDKYLTAFVRARRLVQRISESFSYDDHTLIRLQNDALVRMGLTSFKTEIKELQAGLALSADEENCK